MNQLIKDYFNNIADNYEHPFTQRIGQLLDSLDYSNVKRILDLGSGQGVISLYLYEKSHGEVVALDLSNKMCDIANKNNSNSNIRIINEDFYEYKDKPFDMIVCFDAYPHFLDEKGFQKKANQLLNRGGILAILHDIGRIELNEHHQKTAGKVSRLLKEPSKEAEIFYENFTPICLSEDDNSYKIILKKK